MTWKKVEFLKDDWRDEYYYAYEGEGHRTDGRTTSALALTLNPAAPISVRFPDGTTLVTSLVIKDWFWGIEIDYRGTKAWVDLVNLELFDNSDEGEWSL